MGSGVFKAETVVPNTTAKITSSVSSLEPPVDDGPSALVSVMARDGEDVPFLDASDDIPWEKLVAANLHLDDNDDLVTTLVKREAAAVAAKIHNVDKDIDRHFYGLQDAQARRAGLVAQAQKYASFLERGEGR